MTVVGAVLICAARTIRALLAPPPPGAQRVLATEPLPVVAPLAISFAAFRIAPIAAIGAMRRSREAFCRAIRIAMGAAVGAFAGGALFLGMALPSSRSPASTIAKAGKAICSSL